MASSAEVLLNSFIEIAGGDWAGVGTSEMLRALALSLTTEGEASSEALTQALAQSRVQTKSGTSSTASSSSSGSSTAGTIASTVLSSAFGMVPLAKAIIGLFTGGEAEAPPALMKYALPPSLRFEAANGPGATIQGLDYGQNGLARAQSGYATGMAPVYTTGMAPVMPAAETATAGHSSASQVVIQVNAMDSRSFLDHKEDIAQAVREAMLNMHSLNDVVSDF